MNPNKAFKSVHIAPKKDLVLTDNGSGEIDVRNYSRIKFTCKRCNLVRFLDVRKIPTLTAHVWYECTGCDEVDWTVSIEALRS
jgi:hypothetical protein